jgi:6-phosphogluconolactonase
VTTSVQVYRDADVLAAAVAARLVSRVVDAQAARGTATIVLTGGRMGSAALAALAASPARDAIDWHRIHLWWGDERFLPAGDPDRNETAARAALLDHIDVPSEHIHPFPAAGAEDAETAAAAYAEELAAAARPGQTLPHFDVVLLGVGPDGHVASVFPEHPAAYEERDVVAVHGSPKPPPTRLTLTLPALRTADEVWFVVTGQDKAVAVELALGGAGPVQIPAAGVTGRSRTLWLLDRAAAARVPVNLRDQRYR